MKPLILIAWWKYCNDDDPDDDPNRPEAVWWSDGRPATMDDWCAHLLDTSTKIFHDDGFETLMFPDIVGTVEFDSGIKKWRLYGTGIIPRILDIRDPQAKDEELHAAASVGEYQYRLTIKRG